jgi:uncharacterized protein (DUF1810 family)
VDPGDLERFVVAQDRDGTFDRALGELAAGRKVTHWMWFVFPQLSGLGTSPTSRRFALATTEESAAYLAHPVLGARLRTAAQTVRDGPATTAVELLGPVDAAKLASSMTLFHRTDPGEAVFIGVLDRYFDGSTDQRTDRLLGRST